MRGKIMNWYKIAKVVKIGSKLSKIEDNLHNFLKNNKDYKMTNLDKKAEFPIYLIKKSKPNPKFKNILIAGGFHGDEEAGVWGLEKFLDSNNKSLLNQANVSFLPCINIFGLENNKRKDKNKIDPNRHYDNSKSKKHSIHDILIKNMELILDCSKDGFLSLHESKVSKKFFLYLYSEINNKKYLNLAKSIIKNGTNNDFDTYKKELSVAKGSNYNDAQIICNVEDDESFEKHLFDLEVPICIVTETPIIEDILNKRINLNQQTVRLFIKGLI